MKRPLEDRLRARLVRDEATGCLLWVGRRHRDGSGLIGVYGTNLFVHRAAWSLVHGPIPEGTVIRQVCGRRACAAIEHLVAITKADLARELLQNPVARERARRNYLARNAA